MEKNVKSLKMLEKNWYKLYADFIKIIKPQCVSVCVWAYMHMHVQACVCVRTHFFVLQSQVQYQLLSMPLSWYEVANEGYKLVTIIYSKFH